MPEILDITEPGIFFPEPQTPWWVWLTLALSILFLVVLIYVIHKIRSSRPQAQKASIQRAREEIQEFRKKAGDLEPHEAATELSLIIRRYLAGTFSDPVLFETNEEFTLRERALAKLHSESRPLVKNYLNALSKLKYSPQKQSLEQAEEAIAQHVDHADELLSHIELHLNQPENLS